MWTAHLWPSNSNTIECFNIIKFYYCCVVDRFLKVVLDLWNCSFFKKTNYGNFKFNFISSTTEKVQTQSKILNDANENYSAKKIVFFAILGVSRIYIFQGPRVQMHQSLRFVWTLSFCCEHR